MHSDSPPICLIQASDGCTIAMMRPPAAALVAQTLPTDLPRSCCAARPRKGLLQGRGGINALLTVLDTHTSFPGEPILASIASCPHTTTALT
jgi:hypothetical protein